MHLSAAQDDNRSLSELAQQVKRENIQLAEYAFLLVLLGNDRAVSRQEIEKLALFAVM